MNVLIITEEDVFYVYEFFKTFFPLTEKAVYTVRGITVCAPFNKKSSLALAKQMYGFYGPLQFVIMGMRYLFSKSTGRTVSRLAEKYGIPLIAAGSINAPGYIKKIKDLDTDVIVSVAAPQIFKSEILQAAPRGCINSHSALLPENKGMMPVFWGMYKGAPEIGVTIHYMVEALDAGEIIKQERVPVGNETLHEMILKTKRISARLMHETLEETARGTVTSTPMPAGGSYQTFPTPAEVREFKRRGRKIR